MRKQDLLRLLLLAAALTVVCGLAIELAYGGFIRVNMTSGAGPGCGAYTPPTAYEYFVETFEATAPGDFLCPGTGSQSGSSDVAWTLGGGGGQGQCDETADTDFANGGQYINMNSFYNATDGRSYRIAVGQGFGGYSAIFRVNIPVDPGQNQALVRFLTGTSSQYCDLYYHTTLGLALWDGANFNQILPAVFGEDYIVSAFMRIESNSNHCTFKATTLANACTGTWDGSSGDIANGVNKQVSNMWIFHNAVSSAGMYFDDFRIAYDAGDIERAYSPCEFCSE